MHRVINRLVKDKKFAEALNSLDFVLKEFYSMPVNSEFVRLFDNYNSILKKSQLPGRFEFLKEKYRANILLASKKYSEAEGKIKSLNKYLATLSEKERTEEQAEILLNQMNWLLRASKLKAAGGVLVQLKALNTGPLDADKRLAIQLNDFRLALYKGEIKRINQIKENLGKEIGSIDNPLAVYLLLLTKLYDHDLNISEEELKNKIQVKQYNVAARELKYAMSLTQSFYKIESSSTELLDQNKRVLQLNLAMPRQSLYVKDFQNVSWIKKRFYENAKK